MRVGRGFVVLRAGAGAAATLRGSQFLHRLVSRRVDSIDDRPTKIRSTFCKHVNSIGDGFSLIPLCRTTLGRLSSVNRIDSGITTSAYTTFERNALVRWCCGLSSTS